MKFDLTAKEIELLKNKGIFFNNEHEYSEDEAIELLEQVRNVEISYSQFTGGLEEALYFLYGDLADKIQSQIPDD